MTEGGKTLEIRFTVQGEPRGKERPRFGRGNTYTPSKTSDYEDMVREEYNAQKQNRVFTGAIRAEIHAYYKIPKSISKAKRQEMLDGLQLPVKKPDLDNIAKIILDALNKVAYEDDSQIAELEVKKYYSDDPKVEVLLQELYGEDGRRNNNLKKPIKQARFPCDFCNNKKLCLKVCILWENWFRDEWRRVCRELKRGHEV